MENSRLPVLRGYLLGHVLQENTIKLSPFTCLECETIPGSGAHRPLVRTMRTQRHYERRAARLHNVLRLPVTAPGTRAQLGSRAHFGSNAEPLPPQ